MGHTVPDGKVQVANMGPTWVLSAPGAPHVGHMNLVIRGIYGHIHPSYMNDWLYPICNILHSNSMYGIQGLILHL